MYDKMIILLLHLMFLIGDNEEYEYLMIAHFVSVAKCSLNTFLPISRSLV